MTDTILVDAKGHFKIGKAATTPTNESEGFIASAEDAADAWGISLDDLFGGVSVVLYSGTGMLNTLLSRTGRRLGLITTKGLEDMILMGRGLQAWADYSYADRLHAITHHHPDPLVPRKRTHGVTERIDQFGDVVIPLYDQDVVKAVRALIKDKVEAICIMTIFSHVNPLHEKRIAEIARAEIKKAKADIIVYTSHEVRPVIREQSRLNSVLIEAYATSRGRQQLKAIEDISKKHGFKYGVQTLLSFGGLTSINHPRLHETMISGPIGGILGAASPEIEDGLARYGMHLGTAFQLIDDMLDYSGDESETGKHLGDDLAEGKATLPLIYAMVHSVPQDAEVVRHALQNGGREKFSAVLEIIRSSAALEATRRLAEAEANATASPR